MAGGSAQGAAAAAAAAADGGSTMGARGRRPDSGSAAIPAPLRRYIDDYMQLEEGTDYKAALES